jgi:pyruvate/2-oxoglutarate dehydrogenase complex dihydrolipoamide dehydrogenase (E3) component
MIYRNAVSMVRYKLFKRIIANSLASSLVSGVSLNLPQMLKAKDESVTGLTKGVEGLFKKNKVDYIKGAASFISPTRISIDLLEGGSTEVEGKNIVIVTGSEVAPFPGGAIEIDEQAHCLSRRCRERWWLSEEVSLGLKWVVCGVDLARRLLL